MKQSRIPSLCFIKKKDSIPLYLLDCLLNSKNIFFYFLYVTITYNFQSMKQFYNCRCFLYKNIFLKSMKTHVTYKNEDQFRSEYKNMLDKFKPQEVKCLIEEVSEEIQRRSSIEECRSKRMEEIRKLYAPAHPQLFTLQPEFLHSDFLMLVDKVGKANCAEDIFPYLNVISSDKQLFSFPVFTSEFCEQFLKEMENFENSSLPKGRPNSMNHYGICLDELGLYENFLNPLMKQFLNPLCKLVYPSWTGDELDSQRAFTVKYSLGLDEDLDCHYDNAEVTLNICLGQNFTGSELYFADMRNVSSINNSFREAQHHIGYGILHRGQHIHGVLPLTSGERCNMIMWMRSSIVRNHLCPMCDHVPELVPSTSYGDGFTMQPSNASCDNT